MLLCGCATSRWRGGTPDFKLTGEAARQETDRYTLAPLSVAAVHTGVGYQVGPQERAYTFESLQPLIKAAAPRTARKARRILGKQRLNEKVGWLALALFAGGSVFDGETRQVLQGVGVAGMAWWLGRHVWIRWEVAQLAPVYNQEFGNRFAPRFTLLHRF
jgi:hypothetical protein